PAVEALERGGRASALESLLLETAEDRTYANTLIGEPLHFAVGLSLAIGVDGHPRRGDRLMGQGNDLPLGSEGGCSRRTRLGVRRIVNDVGQVDARNLLLDELDDLT